MSEDLSIALVQTNLHWQDKTANMAMLEEKLSDIPGEVDLVVLPEMFNTGFSMEVEKLAEPPNFNTLKWMKMMASQLSATIAGSFIIKENSQFFNRLHWVTSDGVVDTYDKRHLFRMAEEDQKFSPGSARKVFQIKNWKICGQVCYDLRFPVWSRNTFDEKNGLDYDALIYVANWPKARIDAWDSLLKARAMENHCYAIGLNRVGADSKGIEYNGMSNAYNAKGTSLIDNTPWSEDEIKVITLSASDLKKYREKFPAYLDGDQFNVIT